VAILEDNGELVVAGNNRMEIHYNSGAAAFPFDRISQGTVKTGLAAAHTLKSFDNNRVWVSQDEKGGRFVYKMNEGNAPIRISNVAVERALKSVVNISDAYAWVYQDTGHEFYVLSVPGLPTSWVYDAALSMWHERMYWNSFTGSEELHRGSCHFFFAGENMVGDRESGNIYKLRLDVYTDNGDALHAIRVTPHISDMMKQTTIFDLHLDMETGVGLTGEDAPLVMMTPSKDGGRTFSGERTASFGAIGEYDQRARWLQLGSARDWVFEFKVTDPVQRDIIDCYANVGQGMH
jgi:hypothetical protein